MTRACRFERPHNDARLAFKTVLLAAIVGIAMSQPAAPQQHSANTPRNPETEKAPRGQRDVKDVTYGDWKKLCFKPGGAKMLCRTSIAGTFATGQLAVRLDIIEREGDNIRRVQVFSPVGMYLQNPVKLTIDQGPPHRVPYTWCLTNVCIAGAVAPAPLIKAMTAGQMLRLEFVDSNLLALTTSLPLGQFAAVYRSSPTPIFEQDIDE